MTPDELTHAVTVLSGVVAGLATILLALKLAFGRRDL
jgi:hypothetical protein